jgi:opacity protein-like surface antigen
MKRHLAWMLALLALPAAAQEPTRTASDERKPWLSDETIAERRGISLGGRAMYFQPKNSEAGSGDMFGGAQLRFRFARSLALEGSADYRQISVPGTTVDVYPVQASLLVYLFPSSPLSPFLLGGGGWYFTHTKGPGGFDSTQNRFGGHAGGGLQIFLTQRWSIDGTYRYVWVESFASRDQNLSEKKFSDQGHMATAGLNFHF